MQTISRSTCILAILFLPASVTGAEMPDPLASGEILVGTVHIQYLHAQGAQVYECKVGASGKLAWYFREPIATLLVGGRTVGRHYAGPNWELDDGSAITGKVLGSTPGATPKDIPLLKLEVVARHGAGGLADVTTIERINTKDGVAEGPCQTAGAFLSMPYSADYAFYKKTRWSLIPHTKAE